MALEGAKLVVANHNAERDEETIRHIRDAWDEGSFIATDVSQAEECVRLVRSAVETSGRLDVLVNNAGIYPRDSITAGHGIAVPRDDSTDPSRFSHGLYVAGSRSLKLFNTRTIY